jgi:hypothetical protein
VQCAECNQHPAFSQQASKLPYLPMKLPMNVDFYVGLETFSTNSIATFIAIESPSKPLVKAPTFTIEPESAPSFTQRSAIQENNFWTLENMKGFIMENVHTIGEYYDVLFFYIVVFQIIAYYQEHGSLPQNFKELNAGGILQEIRLNRSVLSNITEVEESFIL